VVTSAQVVGPRKDLLALFAVVAAAHLATLLVGVGSFWHADELIQYIEQPYRVLHGLPLSAWEFQTGTRNWLFPGAILVLLGAAKTIGITDPLVILVLLRLTTKLLFLAAWFRLATVAVGTNEGKDWRQLLPVAMVGLFPLMLFASNHTLSEVWSLIPLIWGIAEWQAALAGKPGRARYAGILFGISILVRLQVVVLLPSLLLMGWWQNRKRTGSQSLASVAVYATITLLCGGLLDAVTYGSFGHSLVANLTAHFGNDGSLFTVMGTTPWHSLMGETIEHGALAVVAIGPLFLVGFWRCFRSPLAWSAILFIAVHSAIPHKELRFLLPALPVVLLVAGDGLLWIVRVVASRFGPLGFFAPILLVATLLTPMALQLAAMDEVDAGATRALAAVSRLSGKPVVVAFSPGRNIWPAQSRFVVGSGTRTVSAGGVAGLVSKCGVKTLGSPLLLFGRQAEIMPLIEPLRRAGCAPHSIGTVETWVLLQLR
jgi:GPI mannosyltransferase 3